MSINITVSWLGANTFRFSGGGMTNDQLVLQPNDDTYHIHLNRDPENLPWTFQAVGFLDQETGVVKGGTTGATTPMMISDQTGYKVVLKAIHNSGSSYILIDNDNYPGVGEAGTISLQVTIKDAQGNLHQSHDPQIINEKDGGGGGGSANEKET